VAIVGLTVAFPAQEPEELLHLPEAPIGIGEELLADDDVDSIPADPAEPSSELRSVGPAGEVGVPEIAGRRVGGVGQDPLLFPRETLRLRRDRVLEREELATATRVEGVVGPCANHGIAQQNDESSIGQHYGDPLRRRRMEEVLGTRLAAHELTSPPHVFPAGEERAVEAFSSEVRLAVEEADLPAEGLADRGMPAQVREEARRSAVLGAEHDEPRESAVPPDLGDGPPQLRASAPHPEREVGHLDRFR
jgi:hypothetical protein